MITGFLSADVAYIFLVSAPDRVPGIVSWGSFFVCTACVTYSWIWAYIEFSKHRIGRRQDRADRALRLSYRAYLRDRFKEAEAALDTVLARTHDDPDLLFFRWYLAVEKSDRSRAKRFLRELKRADVDDKWRSTVQREEARRGEKA